jgi:hypothetical protein
MHRSYLQEFCEVILTFIKLIDHFLKCFHNAIYIFMFNHPNCMFCVLILKQINLLSNFKVKTHLCSPLVFLLYLYF